MIDEEVNTDPYERDLKEKFEREADKKSGERGEVYDESKELIKAKDIVEQMEKFSKNTKHLPESIRLTGKYLQGQIARYKDVRVGVRQEQLNAIIENRGVMSVEDQIRIHRDKLFKGSMDSSRAIYERLRKANPSKVDFINQLEEEGKNAPIQNTLRIGLQQAAENENFYREAKNSGGLMSKIADERQAAGKFPMDPAIVAIIEQIRNLRGITGTFREHEGKKDTEAPKLSVSFTNDKFKEYYREELKKEGIRDVQDNPKGGLDITLELIADHMEEWGRLAEAFSLKVDRVQEKVDPTSKEEDVPKIPRTPTVQGKLVGDPERESIRRTYLMSAKTPEEWKDEVASVEKKAGFRQRAWSRLKGTGGRGNKYHDYDAVLGGDPYSDVKETPKTDEEKAKPYVHRAPIWGKGDEQARVAWAMGENDKLSSGKYTSEDILEDLIEDSKNWAAQMRDIKGLNKYLKAMRPDKAEEEKQPTMGDTLKTVPGSIWRGTSDALKKKGGPIGKVAGIGMDITQLMFEGMGLIGKVIPSGLTEGLSKAGEGAAQGGGGIPGGEAAAGAAKGGAAKGVGAAKAAGPAGIIMAVVQKIGELMEAGIQILTKIWELLVKASPQLHATLKLLWRGFMLWLRPIGDILGVMLRPIARWFVTLNRDAMKAGRKEGKPGSAEYQKAYMKSWFAGFTTGFWEELVVPLFEAITTFVPALIEQMMPVMLLVFGLIIPVIIAAVIYGILKVIWDFTEWAARALGEFIAALPGKLVEWILGGIDKVSNFLQDLLADIISWILGGIDKVSNFLTDVFSSVKEWILGGIDKVSNFLSSIFTSAKEWILGGIGTVSNFLSSIFTSVKDWLLSGIGSLSNFLGGIIDAIWGAILGTSSSTDTYIPSESPPENEFASGGIVTEAQRAIVGEGDEPEAIIPLSRLQSYLNMAPSQSIDEGDTTSVSITWQQNAPIYGVKDLRKAVESMLDDYFRTKVAVR